MEPSAMLAEAGFDIVHPFDAAACGRELGVAVLADPTRPLGLLVGNTRALWPRFLAARRADPALAAAEHPIQRYVETTCEHVEDARCWFAHRRYGDGGGAFLPFQRIAVAAGLGTLAPTQLVIHPVYGPWFALRAVVLVAGEPVTRNLPVPACSCDPVCHRAMARALAASGPDAWRAWLGVRDACCVGRDYRYSDDQIEYHYVKDPALLRRS